jgi:tRNA A-37 threonylcarbamoyl transferase component Bud32
MAPGRNGAGDVIEQAGRRAPSLTGGRPLAFLARLAFGLHRAWTALAAGWKAARPAAKQSNLAVTVVSGDVRWQVRPDWRPHLFGPHGLLLEHWRRTGQAVTIKHGPHRTVYRVTLPGRSFYVKQFRLHNRRAWLRELLRPSKARMEHERACILAGRGVPTVVPLAVGEPRRRRWPGESFLITQALEGTEPLDRFLDQTLPRLGARRAARVRQRLAAALGELAARTHAAGITHLDFHERNVLVQLGPGDRPRLFLIDVHNLHAGRPLRWRARRANLVMLNRWFVTHVSRADRLRFWRAYCRHWPDRPATPAFFAEAARDLEGRTWAWNLKFHRKRDRRCLAANRYYQQLRQGGIRGHVVADLGAAALAGLLADPGAPFRQAGGTGTVAAELTVGGRVRHCQLTRFAGAAAAGLAAWLHGHGLRERAFCVPRPLAGWRHGRGRSAEHFLLTEDVRGAASLDAWLAGLAPLDPHRRSALVRPLLERLARTVRQLHQHHLAHGGLDGKAILVGGWPTASAPRPACTLWLTRLCKVACRRRVSRALRIRDLARLHASLADSPALTRSDRLRFLQVYLQWGLAGRGGWKTWWRAILERMKEEG